MSFGEIQGLTLKKWLLLRKLYLQELLQIETKPCALCDMNREIIYSASYDRDLNVECFDVCQLCGIELIQVSDAIVKSLRP